MKYLIADLVTEFTPKYENLRLLAEQFRYDGSRLPDFTLKVTDERIEKTDARMSVPDKEKTENFLYAADFNRSIIKHGGMLVHSSGIITDGKAYLFSADSGVGKSTHTRLWLREFGDRVHIFNDDKPVIRIYGKDVTAYGTPFDGGSGIALNESAPLKAIVFIERGERNSVRVPSSKEIIQKLYFQTSRLVNSETAQSMLQNFEALINSNVKFYILTCNMNPEAAQVAYNAIV